MNICLVGPRRRMADCRQVCCRVLPRYGFRQRARTDLVWLCRSRYWKERLCEDRIRFESYEPIRYEVLVPRKCGSKDRLHRHHPCTKAEGVQSTVQDSAIPLSNGNWAVTSAYAFMNFPLLTRIKEISPRPVLIVIGDHAFSRYFGEDAYKAAERST